MTRVFAWPLHVRGGLDAPSDRDVLTNRRVLLPRALSLRPSIFELADRVGRSVRA